MLFYSGFSLKNDKVFFKDFLESSEYAINGFSYGAIKATKKALEMVKDNKRVDKLVLLSPAFFQTKPTKFKRLQLMGYKKDKRSYLREFLRLSFLPYSQKSLESTDSTYEELEELLNYEWNEDELRFLKEKGVKIEVYLGGEDKIIDAQKARDFFVNLSSLTYIKNGNHFLEH